MQFLGRKAEEEQAVIVHEQDGSFGIEAQYDTVCGLDQGAVFFFTGA